VAVIPPGAYPTASPMYFWGECTAPRPYIRIVPQPS
jgi:hypothetical protein